MPDSQRMWAKNLVNFSFSTVRKQNKTKQRKAGEVKKRGGDQERIFGKSFFTPSALTQGKKFQQDPWRSYDKSSRAWVSQETGV